MVNYQCELCFKIFPLKGNFAAHLKRKKPCFSSSAVFIPSKEQCKKCLKTYSNKYNRLRHENTCSHILQISTTTADQDVKILSLEKKIAELETMIKQGINPISNITIGNVNNTIVQNFFIINKYGHEDLSYITEKQKLNNIKKIYMSVPSFILLKHFNKDHPENSNVYISNLKNPYALIYNGTTWVVTDRNKLLQEMYDDNYCEVIHNYKEMKAQLDEKTIEGFTKFLNDQDDDKLITKLKNDIKLILYNNREQILKINK
jgi:hypothetical protein